MNIYEKIIFLLYCLKYLDNMSSNELQNQKLLEKMLYFASFNVLKISKI